MSRTKQLPGTRSFSVVQSDTATPVIRIGRHNAESHKSIQAIVLRLALEALGRFTSDVVCIIADALTAALSWLLKEFLAGCSTYAEAMYPIAAIDERDSSLNRATPAPERVSPTPAATRLRLVVVAGAAQVFARPHDQLPPRPAAGGAALRDWTSSQDIEMISAPAARRKNGPR